MERMAAEDDVNKEVQLYREWRGEGKEDGWGEEEGTGRGDREGERG